MTRANQLTLTKAELMRELECTTWARFYKKFMTPDVIEQQLGLTPEQYKRIREFSVGQTRKLREYFELN